MSEDAAEKAAPEPHGEIKVRDHKGYSVYYCADCGQNINSPGCSGKRSRPTFDDLLNDPTQQLDDGTVLRSIRTSPATDMGSTAAEAHTKWERRVTPSEGGNPGA